ncbi:AfsR/SARP family transcriptional regulator [Kutzneria kofuensis]|uniref:DNA-binding SARP family transcriptional activator/tetratricopeptide (TPR) repeat protein n=1 Tax=Kutzneria kofuensis TaxID=103725 RepID=A0A7W9KAA3_9PSEU|nr:BTAD domain-containing putative transcriptional regulator [Kutzneria kofuensis]MBB5888820.1 DNA-binding SARP family transcriptional activator/tetratricopeptide (TPR) repeat protein [Kutzneria kofuensis]
MESSFWWTVLGPVRGRRAGREARLGSPQRRVLMALLLARAGQPLAMAEITRALWHGDPPELAANVVQGHVGAIRRMLEPELPRRATGRWLLPVPGGYRLAMTAETLDLLRFRELTAGQPSLGDLVEALSLATGDVAEDVPAEVRSHPVFTAVAEEYDAVLRAAADRALKDGMAAAVLPMVRAAVGRRPLDEELQASLMLLLHADGQHAAALELFGEVRDRLRQELGVHPGRGLHEAYRRVLADQPAESVPFIGREKELSALLARLPQPAEPAAVIAVTGMAGVGKTSLAMRAAQLAADRFPDGVLHVDLHGFTPGRPALTTTEAVRALLDVPDMCDPAALYRSSLAGRRMLVVLDNARDAEQARELLPGSDGCAAIVTSRDDLSGLVAFNDAYPIRLGLTTTGAPLTEDVRTSFTRSYEALSPAAATLFHALALHPTRDVEPVVAASMIGDEPQRARVLLAELASAHLIDEYRPGRYSWHGLVHDYGVEMATSRLPDAERDQLRRRLFDHYLFNNRQVGAIARMKLAAVPPEARVTPACAGYEAERLMLRSLMTQALAEGYGEYVWRFAGVIGDHLERAGGWSELLAAGTAALVAAERSGDPARTAQALRGLARVHAGLRDYPRAIELLSAAMPLFVAVDDRKALAGLHLGSAWLRAKAGRPAAGALHADRTLTITRRDAEPVGVASMLSAVGWFEARQARYEAAIGHSREALGILSALGMRRAQADTWDTLGFVNRRLGRYREALASYRRALALHREFGARAAEAATLRCIATVTRPHDPPASRKALDEAVEILRELGDPAADRMVSAADSHQS